MDRCKGFLKILLINSASAFIPPILLLAFSFQHFSLERLYYTFLFSLIYAQCIGCLNFATMPAIWPALSHYKPWLRWPGRVVAIFINTVIGSLIACSLLVAIHWLPMEHYWEEFWGSLKIATVIALGAGIAIGMYETFEERLAETTMQLRTKELERERALKLATEAQLASLESRIHPHFLFNTLNSISSLIPEDPARAERLIGQMAALLRFSLDANQAGLVPLASELKIVEDYLEIERARFGDRLRYRIDLAGELNGSRVPPLAVQTLVENSVKFAIAPSRTGGEISISAARENGLLRVNIQDPGPPFALDATPAGHGLDNLKGRLATLFGQQAAITLERRGETNNLTLTVPQSNADPSISR